MKLFAWFERWLNEHGSAAIQAKHIAFLKEQFTALEKEHALTQERLEQAEARIRELEAENQNLSAVIQSRDDEIAKLTKKAPFAFDVVERPPSRADGL